MLGNVGKTEVGVCIFIGIVLGPMIAGTWKIFKKAEKPGWYAIIPIYDIMVLLQIINLPRWLVLLIFIDYLDLILLFIISIQLASYFGKSKVWGFFLLFLLPILGYPILGFGSAKYNALYKEKT